MLSTSAYALPLSMSECTSTESLEEADLLGVHCTFELCKVGGGVDGSEEDGFVLVHSSIGEEERWIGVRDHRRGGYWPAISMNIPIPEGILGA